MEQAHSVSRGGKLNELRFISHPLDALCGSGETAISSIGAQST